MSPTNALAAPAQVQPTALAVPSRPTWDLIEVNPAVDVDDILSIVKKRLPWLIALPAACVVVALIYVYLIATPMFKSSAMIFIDPNFDSIIQVENVGAAVSDIDSLNSMEKAIVSDSMILRVIDKLNLRSDLDFLPKSLHKTVQSGQEVSGSRLLAEIKKSRISASLIRPTRLLELTVFDTNPQRAQLIARTFVDEFELFLGEQKRKEAGNSSVELRRQADEAYRRALASETALEEFRMKNPGMTVEQDHQLFGERLTKIGDELNNISGRV
ncbi:MAG: hypothetical protein KDL87_17670, partial [Verrucomicrobiae bacterium]|nr:hypothetical protein [Verrucomicrobiae bacterium]